MQVTLVFSWANLLFFYDLPRWLLFLTPSEILVIFTYAITFAFFDSLAFLALVLVPSLPFYRKYLQDTFVPAIGAVSLVSYFWMTYLRFLYQLSLARDPDWVGERLPLWLLLALATTLLTGVLVSRNARMRKCVSYIADMTQALLYLYLPLSAICMLVVAVRNWI